MHISIRFATASLFAATALLAQTVTVPAVAAGVAGNSSNAFPWGSAAATWPGLRLQAVYDSSILTNAGVTGNILIQRLRWYANDSSVATTWVGGTFAAADVRMSTAAVDWAAVTTDFATNHGGDLQTVYSGAVAYAAGTGQGAGVRGPVVVDLTLTTPFLYNPANGDLVIDVDYAGGANFTAAGAGTALSQMDVQTTGSLSSRVFASTNYPVANGTAQNHGPVVGIEFTKVLEVSSPATSMTLIDMDAAGAAGPTSVAALNAAGNPVAGTIANITLTPSTATNPGVYNTNTTLGRALGLGFPGGGLTLLDPPTGQFASFDMRIDLLRPSQEFGIAIADFLGPMVLDFYSGPTLLWSHTSSSYSTADLKYYRFVDGSFDRVDVRASTTAGNWVIPQLAIQGYAATATQYGDACYDDRGSFNELFSPASSLDLAGGSLSMVFNAATQRYTVRSGLTSYFPPGGGAVSLALIDDSQTTVNLASSLAFPGGSTTSLVVCSNGFISAASGNGIGFSPSLEAFRTRPQAIWASWHDYNPASPGSGQVKFEQVANFSIVTWDGVYGFSDPTPSTLQFQFDRNTGNVHMHWGTMSTGGNAHLVGWKGTGIGLPNPAIDISAALPGTFPAYKDLVGLRMTASARPVIGTGIAVVTDNIPANAVLSASLLSLGFSPPVSLAPVGMPGCFRHIDASTAASVLLFGSPQASQLFTIPNNGLFAGLDIFGQAYSLVPGVNPTGALSSNGLRLSLEVF